MTKHFEDNLLDGVFFFSDYKIVKSKIIGRKNNHTAIFLQTKYSKFYHSFGLLIIFEYFDKSITINP